MAESDARPTGEQKVQKVRQHSFVEIDHEILSMVISSPSPPPPSTDSRKIVVTFWRKTVHKYWVTAQRTKPAQSKFGQVS